MSGTPPTPAPPPTEGGATPKGPQPAKKQAGRDIPWSLVALGALVVYVVLFVLLNDERVKVSFVFFSTTASLIVALVVALAVGFLLGFFADVARTRRRNRKQQKS